MKSRGFQLLLLIAFALCVVTNLRADDLLTMGITALRALDPTLTGTGVTVGQAEAQIDTNAAFEINPAAVGEPQSFFNWISTNGNYTNFPNAAGTESSHAEGVGDDLFGAAFGVAPGIVHLDNYEADYFYNLVVVPRTAIPDAAVNQSFTFGIEPPDQQPVDSAYDNFIANNSTVMCSGAVGVGTSPGAPGTAYNCIGIGGYGAYPYSIIGPTLDNGRSKPDIVGPGNAISFIAPYVTGAAAILLQAGARGDGGTNTSAAIDRRTVKALLLNSALKPFDWTNSTTATLDQRYGAGVLNVYYAHQQLAGGQYAYTSSGTVGEGVAHPPIATGALMPARGWDFESITTLLSDAVNHYLFNVTNDSTFTGTLVWERHANLTSINNLGLFLYNATTGALLGSSVSTVDNVQQIYIPHVTAGKYDLEVVKYGSPTKSVTPAETYALAYQFFPISAPAMSITEMATNMVVTWPSSPTVFTFQQTTNLVSPVVWTTVTNAEWITNATVWVNLPPSGTDNFFRLVR